MIGAGPAVPLPQHDRAPDVSACTQLSPSIGARRVPHRAVQQTPKAQAAGAGTLFWSGTAVSLKGIQMDTAPFW